jgi:hypothetical protein
MIKPKVNLDHDHDHHHENDKSNNKKIKPTHTKAMNDKTHKVAAKAHRKTITR